MRRYGTEEVIVIKEKVCDRCGACHLMDTPEFNEFLSFSRTVGYKSVFGDGNKLSLDLCQDCSKKILGQWLSIE